MEKLSVEERKPKYSEGDKVEQLSDPGLVLTVKSSLWVGHTFRYAFEECYVEVFEEYIRNYWPCSSMDRTEVS